MFSIQDSKLIAFVSIFNLLDFRNQNGVEYNHDYTQSTYDYYQRRSVYFGGRAILLITEDFQKSHVLFHLAYNVSANKNPYIA